MTNTTKSGRPGGTSSRPGSTSTRPGSTSSQRTSGKNRNVESSRKKQNDDVEGLPRLIARVWGLVAGISFVSNGGYLLFQSDAKETKCKGAGAYMIIFGLAVIVMECACCLCPAKPAPNCCDKFEENFPFWGRSLMYFLSVILPIALCPGTKTIISSILVIMQGMVYGILYCLVKTKRYERLQQESKRVYQEQKNTYGALSSVNNAVGFIKSGTATMTNMNPQSAKGKSGSARTKKPKPRAATSV